MKNCPDGTHCQNEYLIEDLEQEVAIRTVEYDEAKELADDLYLLLVDDPRTKAMADEVIRLHQAKKTTPYAYTLQQRIDELEATIGDIKELAEIASMVSLTLQGAIFHINTIRAIADKAQK